MQEDLCSSCYSVGNENLELSAFLYKNNYAMNASMQQYKNNYSMNASKQQYSLWLSG